MGTTNGMPSTDGRIPPSAKDPGALAGTKQAYRDYQGSRGPQEFDAKGADGQKSMPLRWMPSGLSKAIPTAMES